MNNKDERKWTQANTTVGVRQFRL